MTSMLVRSVSIVIPNDKDISPNPGSEEAINSGCICDIANNNHGFGCWKDREATLWYINQECPLHAQYIVYWVYEANGTKHIL